MGEDQLGWPEHHLQVLGLGASHVGLDHYAFLQLQDLELGTCLAGELWALPW